MKIMLSLVFICLTLLVCAGCQRQNQKTAVVSISISNDSTNALSWVELRWPGPFVPGGAMPPGVSKTALDVEWPNLTNAKLIFLDEKTRLAYTNEISLSEANNKVNSGNCTNLLIRILSYNQVVIEAYP